MIALQPLALEGHGVRLEPMTDAETSAQAEGLAAAALDGRL